MGKYLKTLERVEGNRTLVISLEGSQQPSDIKTYSDIAFRCAPLSRNRFFPLSERAVKHGRGVFRPVMTSGLKAKAALSERGDDLYETPPVAVTALLERETLPSVVWEPACGPGAIVGVLRAAGHTVIATDLNDWGCPDRISWVPAPVNE